MFLRLRKVKRLSTQRCNVAVRALFIKVAHFKFLTFLTASPLLTLNVINLRQVSSQWSGYTPRSQTQSKLSTWRTIRRKANRTFETRNPPALNFPQKLPSSILYGLLKEVISLRHFLQVRQRSRSPIHSNLIHRCQASRPRHSKMVY